MNTTLTLRRIGGACSDWAKIWSPSISKPITNYIRELLKKGPTGDYTILLDLVVSDEKGVDFVVIVETRYGDGDDSDEWVVLY